MILYKPKQSSWLIDYDFSPVLSRHVYKVIYFHNCFTAINDFYKCKPIALFLHNIKEISH